MRISDWSSDVCSSDLFAFLRLFLGGIGNDNAAGRLFLSLDAANQHTIVQRTKFHASSFPWVSSDECFGTPRRRVPAARHMRTASRSEEHTSELQSLMRISYAVFCLKKKKQPTKTSIDHI